jgi:hypothetical protein
MLVHQLTATDFQLAYRYIVSAGGLQKACLKLAKKMLAQASESLPAQGEAAAAGTPGAAYSAAQALHSYSACCMLSALTAEMAASVAATAGVRQRKHRAASAAETEAALSVARLQEGLEGLGCEAAALLSRVRLSCITSVRRARLLRSLS